MQRRHAIAALSLPAGLSALSSAGADDALRAAVAGAHRTPAFVERDRWRHPYETLSFFGIGAAMTVVELNPGGGWYTEILAPYLREHGRLLLGVPDPESPNAGARRVVERLRQRLQAQPALYDRVQLAVFEPPRRLALADAGTLDAVLTFRNLHNWVAAGDEVARAVFAHVATSLKRGGVFGIVDHRLPESRAQTPRADSGYLKTSDVVKLAEGAGLRLAAASEVNANPRDGADHEGGVWALPPTFANKERDRERYAAIGESDRMTLRFVKA